MKRQGVSIVLVTHNTEFVRAMCDRALWLDRGRIRGDGPVELVLEQYMAEVQLQDEASLLSEELAVGRGDVTDEAGKVRARHGSKQRWGTREAEIVRVQLLDGQEREQRIFETGSKLIVRLHFTASQSIENPQFGLALHHADGFHISGPNTVFSGLDIPAIEGSGQIDYVVESLPLLEGTYLLSASLYDHEGAQAYDHHHQAYRFRVRPSAATGEEYGSIHIQSSWIMGQSSKGN